MKVQRAAKIANDLNDVELWNSHGRGISRRVLVDKLNLRISDFGALPSLNKCIREYYRLLKSYMLTTGHHNLIHTRKQFSMIAPTKGKKVNTMKRRKTLDINRMIANNPRIDVEQLVRSMKIVKRLAKSGVRRGWIQPGCPVHKAGAYQERRKTFTLRAPTF